MAVSEYHLDTRIRRRYIPLVTQQRRLRHLRSISARNVTLDVSQNFPEFNLYFSLHQRPNTDAFYTSEKISESINPSWKDFESSNFPENIDAASLYVTVKIWSKADESKLIMEWITFFSGLVFLGEQIPKEGKNFKPDTLIFGMSEGYYGCPDCYQHNLGKVSDVATKDSLVADSTGLRTSYTLSTLSRIKTVERAIKQTQATVQRRRNSIKYKLQGAEESHKKLAHKEMLKIKISVLKTELQIQQKNLMTLVNDLTWFKEDLLVKEVKVNESLEHLKKERNRWIEMRQVFCEISGPTLKTDGDELAFRRKQLLSELNSIYPIVEFPDHKGFSIREVHLPNSEKFAGHDETMIAIALGYVCHTVLMISHFLNVPLRYSVRFYGSCSHIIDHISSSIPDKNREFPLYSKGKDRRFFEYGVFLLNKDIAQLRHLWGLTTKDLSATLPNLNSLTEVMLSINSDPYSNLQGSGYLYSRMQSEEPKIPILADKFAPNGFTNFSDHSSNVPIQRQLSLVCDTEIEFLKKEMQAMMPNSVVLNENNTLKIPSKNTDASNALSCSLDKGLNDLKLLEKSLETVTADHKPVPLKATKKIKHLLLQNHHHSSYPNLTSGSQTVETFSGSQLPSMSPRVWANDSSHTNSEDDIFEDCKSSPKVLNDSIFYIPSSNLTGSREKSPKFSNSECLDQQKSIEKALIGDDFTEELALRTEQLANRTSSFQMQRLRTSSSEEEHLPHK